MEKSNDRMILNADNQNVKLMNRRQLYVAIFFCYWPLLVSTCLLIGRLVC